MCEIMNESFKTVFTAEDDFTEPNRTWDYQGLQEIAVHKEDVGSQKTNGARWCIRMGVIRM
ncbi:hypothetical protein E2C01_032353 [Portunus trituberculatus]|uniref:Uncharacterized protein n=1 Tax=Portunus trituberculatus TaxID=210409 RepID=A0A5B7F029_PORTR|nr:hypothetical protein [Portunus trituberculatus]